MRYVFSLPQVSSKLVRVYAASIEVLTYDDESKLIKAERWVDGELKEFNHNKRRFYVQKADVKNIISQCKDNKNPQVLFRGEIKSYYTDNKQEAILIQLYYASYIKELMEKKKNRLEKIIDTLPKEDEDFIKNNFPHYFI